MTIEQYDPIAIALECLDRAREDCPAGASVEDVLERAASYRVFIECEVEWVDPDGDGGEPVPVPEEGEKEPAKFRVVS